MAERPVTGGVSTGEFYRPAAGPELGDPHADLPGTYRIEHFEARFDAAARRAVRTTSPGAAAWVVFAGPAGGPGLQVGDPLTSAAVAGWPVCSPIVTSAAFRLARRAAEPVEPARVLDGDMDVEAFRG